MGHPTQRRKRVIGNSQGSNMALADGQACFCSCLFLTLIMLGSSFFISDRCYVYCWVSATSSNKPVARHQVFQGKRPTAKYFWDLPLDGGDRL